MAKPLVPGHPLPALNEDGSIDVGDELTNIRGIQFQSAVEAPISSGAITIDHGHIKVDTESDAANDDLDTINSSHPGEVLFLLPANDARTVRIRDGEGNIHTKHQVQAKSYSFSSPSGSSGTFYVAGFYNWASADANLTQASLTVTHGSANHPYAAHAGLVAAAAGATDTGTVSIVVSGTSMDDEANRSAADSETLVADITAMATDQFFSTTKKWLGTVTYTLTGAGGAGTFNADFNYGFCKYEDFGNQDFTVTNLECVGLAGANDTGFNIRLFHHNSSGWTYAATGFTPGGTVLANMNTDHSTEQDLASGEQFAYKRVDLNTDVDGEDSEGLVLELITSANKAIEFVDVHIGVHTHPKYAYMSTTTQHLIFMKHGDNWLEL